MTTRISIPACEVRIGDFIYNGLGTSKHPTDSWETITRIDNVDGLILLITGRLDGPHGEFWFEPEETVVVVRHPPATPEPAAVKPQPKHHHKRSPGH